MTYSFAPSNQPLYVREGDFIQFKFKAPSTWDTTLTVTVKIGNLTQFWSIITVPEDFTPDPFPLEDIEDAELDTMYYYADGNRPSEAVLVISGLTDTTEAPIQISSTFGVPAGGNPLDYYGMRIDFEGTGTSWSTGSAATDYYITTDTGIPPRVKNGSRVTVKSRTKNFSNIKTRLTLQIGTSFEYWDILTKPIPVNAPEPFPEFTDIFNQPLNTYIYTPEVIQVNGLFDPGAVTVTGGEFAVSNNANTVTNGDGFDILSGVTWASSGTVTNGQYIQLRILTTSNANTILNAGLSIAEGTGSTWTITTEDAPSENPDPFSFPNVGNVNVNTLVGSEQRPTTGISGLGEGISVPVELLNTTSSLVRIKINNGSIGLFPTTVTNGDTIRLYLTSAATIDTIRSMQIKVGDRTITTWGVETFSGPDDTPSNITPPANRTGVIPGTYVTSSPVQIPGINVPVTITSTNVNSLISIDYDTPSVGPRTFDPAINNSFRIVLLSASNLSTEENTQVSIGTTGAVNNPFIWRVTTYATVPVNPAANLGVWYSKKTAKEDGYSIGTILPIPKQGLNNYGQLTDGGLTDRYPGFIECNGQSLDPNEYESLYEVIALTYGGNVTQSVSNVNVSQTRDGVTYSSQVVTKSYNGTFNVPDYRNRRLCGTGIVDSARGNSVFVPISNGKLITEPGAEGGYWFFDKVNPFGPEPLEQIQGPIGTTSGLNSQFYSLGTVRVRGTETLTDNIQFTITGQVEGQIGELQELVVGTPEHDHIYYAAVAETERGFPLIQWGNVTNGRGMFQTADGTDSANFRQFFESGLDPAAGEGENNAELIRAGWLKILGTDAFSSEPSIDFENSLRAYYGDDWDGFPEWIEEYFGTGMTGEETGEDRIDTFNNAPVLNFEIPFYTWWLSDYDAVSGVDLRYNLAAVPMFGCVFDLRPATFTIDNFLSASGTTLGHSHKMTQDPVVNFQTDFTGGNVGKQGNGGSEGSGLTNGSNEIDVIFTQSDIFMELTEGTFEFSRSFIKPVPDVTMVPQDKAPILVPFHKTKYIIKAF